MCVIIDEVNRTNYFDKTTQNEPKMSAKRVIMPAGMESEVNKFD